MTISKRLTQKFGSPERGVARALRTEIEQALSEHWTIKQIWEELCSRGSVACSYRTFCRILAKEMAGKAPVAPMAVENVKAEPMKSKLKPDMSIEGSIQNFVFERLDISDLI